MSVDLIAQGRGSTLKLPEKEYPLFPRRLHDLLAFQKDSNKTNKVR
jgi:hypothetical protein